MRLIDAEALMKRFDPEEWPDTDFSPEAVQYMIAQERTAVVCCKNCRKYIREDWKRILYDPRRLTDETFKVKLPSGCMGMDDPETGFCSEAERKE